MKTIIIAACFFIGMGAATQKEVYCTAKGAKYHTHQDCRWLKNKELTAISLEEAKKQSKDICKTCLAKDTTTIKTEKK